MYIFRLNTFEEFRLSMFKLLDEKDEDLGGFFSRYCLENFINKCDISCDMNRFMATEIFKCINFISKYCDGTTMADINTDEKFKKVLVKSMITCWGFNRKKKLLF